MNVVDDLMFIVLSLLTMFGFSSFVLGYTFGKQENIKIKSLGIALVFYLFLLAVVFFGKLMYPNYPWETLAC